MRSFARAADLIVVPIGHVWAAFSSASGETVLLNDETAAILEVLESGPATSGAVCNQLASDSDLEAEVLAENIESSWPRLVEAGLVRELQADRAALQ